MKTKRRSPSVVTNDQDSNSAVQDAKQEMVWKSLEIHAPEIALANAVCFGKVRGLLEGGSQLAVELIGKLSSGNLLVVIHDPRDVRRDLPMKLQTHQPRRPWI